MKKRIGRQLLAGLLAFGMVLTMPYVTLDDVWAEETEIAIDKTNFPDAVFREYVETNFDEDSNGKLSQSEMDAVTTIDITRNTVTTLKGVEYFTTLKELICFGNKITTLDVSKNTALMRLDCGNNQLTKLSVSKNTELTSLSCNYNQLTELDVRKNTALKVLTCYGNELKSLDVSNNISLEKLYCYDNHMACLDLSNNKSIDAMMGWVNADMKIYVSSAIVDLSKYADMDVSKISNVTGGQLESSILKLEETTCSYDYDCGSNCMLTVKFIINPQYQITYELNGGTNASGNPTSYTSTSDTITLQAPTKAGYTFAGWFTDAEFTKPITEIVKGNSENITLYAKWTENGSSSDGQVAINETNFPDAVFREYVETNFDKNSDGKLSQSEISAATTINVSGDNKDSGPYVSSLKGVEYFTALTELYCSDNELTALDVSANTALTELDCGWNKITSLDVSENTALTSLNCDNNQLTSLDVSKNTALTDLDCAFNQLTALDVSANTALGFLTCTSNHMAYMDVSKNTKLKADNTSCTGMTITVPSSSVDLSKYTGLDVSRISNVTGGTLVGTVLTFTSDAITYNYDCGNGITLTATWTQEKTNPEPTPTPEPTPSPAPTVKNGWVVNTDGTYSYYRDDVMLTNQWLQDGDTWYYLSSNGTPLTGWQVINGSWYYFDENGKMASDTWIGDSYVTESGAWLPNAVVKEWKNSGGRWWYQNADGSYPASQWKKIDGNWYYFDNAGWMETGWKLIGNTWYYMNTSGAMATGWLNDGGTWYYLKEDGAMQTGWVLVDNTWYYMNGSGAMQTSWVQVGNTWYYMNASGAMETGWLNNGGTWYYLNVDGAMQTGWVSVDDTWYYMNDSGAMQTGWQKIGNNWYYMDSNGAMAHDTVIDGYTVNSDGVWV